jgi:hypothetical protein
MVTILPREESTATQLAKSFGDSFGASAGQAYMGRSDEMALRKAIEGLPANASPRDILNAITNTNTYSPEAKQTMLKNYLGVAEFEELQRKAKVQEETNKAKNVIEQNKLNKEETKTNLDREKVKSLVNLLNVPEEQKGALSESIDLKTAQDLIKEQSKSGEGKLTPFEKKIQEENAKKYIDLAEKIPQIESTIGDIAYARELSNELGVTGTVGGLLGLSGKAKELEAVSFTLMEPIVKIFNPSGPIAQQKLKMIQDKYVIKPSDAPWIRNAKLDALDRFSKQALNRANKKLDLIKKYDGNPPPQEIDKFDKESDTISDAMVDYDLIGEEIKQEQLPKELPDPKLVKGKTITSPEGQKYYSDGTRWVKK